MPVLQKKILILDEGGFSRVCSAILEFEGYSADTMADLDSLQERLEGEEFGLIVTSYPFGSFFLREIEKRKIPMIILCDHINRELFSVLEGVRNACCMMKPLDYLKFKSLVKQMMGGKPATDGGYRVV
jgi:DNA-binding NtrC family response regulator